LLIVDDHPIVRAGLATVLQQFASDWTVLVSSSAREGLKMIEANADLDAVLVDLAMPGVDGFSALCDFSELRPELPLIVFSSSESAADIREALRRGALGYIPKSTEPRTLISAVTFVLDGNVYVPPLYFSADPVPPARVLRAPSELGAKLTERQIAVLKLICDGRPNKEIANILELSDKTVKSHITSIFKALNVVNRTQASNAAREMGITTDQPR
jgi:DNA-binding NarL/FixJ family response regulator